MSDDWMQTYSGGQFYFLGEGGESRIDIIDIARALSRQRRFLGHSSAPVSIAEHSVAVAEIVRVEGGTERQQLLGLLHDAHEAYVGDSISPLKRVLLERYAVDLGALGRDIQARILKALKVAPPTPPEMALVERADLYALAAERQLFMPSAHAWSIDRISPPGYTLGLYGNWDDDEAMRHFEKTYERLTASTVFEQRIAASVDANG